MTFSILKRAITFLTFLLLLGQIGRTQTIAEGLPGCLDPLLVTNGITCPAGGTSIFGIVGTTLVVRNIDGLACCPGGASGGGDFESFFEFDPINICSYSNVSISMDYEGVLLNGHMSFEDNSPGSPLFGCGNPFTNSHDQIVFTYSIDNGPEIQSLYVHGTTEADFTGTWNVAGINGNTLRIRVYASNKATDESFEFSNLRITGSPQALSAGPNDDICAGTPYTMQGMGCGSWSGGVGSFTNANQTNAVYNHAPSEVGSIVNLTYSGTPVTAQCGNTFPPPSDNMSLFINILEASINGGGILCPGDCEVVTASFVGGTPPYNLSFSFTSGGIALPVVFSLPFDINDELTICYGTGLFPIFDQSTRTLTLPSLVAGNTGTLTLNGVADGSCTGTVTGNPVTFTFAQNPVGQPQTLTSCDVGNDEGIFDLSSIETDILNGSAGSVFFYSDMLLTNPIPNLYLGPSTTVYAQIENANGCLSAPIPITLEIVSGDVGMVQFNCQTPGDCDICDSDGIPGELVELDFIFPNTSINYQVEIFANINGVSTTNTFTIPGINGSVNYMINGNAFFQVISITPEDGCLDNTDMPPILTINYFVEPTIVVTSPISECNPINLPPIVGQNVAGAYYNSAPDGSGVNYSAGQTISSSITLYAIAGQVPTCYASEPLVIEIGSSITLLAPPNDTTCGTYTLPNIPGQGMGSTVSYFTGSMGTGNNLLPGTMIDSTTTLFIYDPNTNCPSNEPIFTITIIDTIRYDSLPSLQGCDFVILDTIRGIGFTDSVRYYDSPLGLGMVFHAGDTIRNSDTLYIWDHTLNCPQDSAVVSINIGEAQILVAPNDTTVCGEFILPSLLGSSTAAYYTAINGMGNIFRPGDTIRNVITLYVYDPANTCSTSQDSFTASVFPQPIFDLPAFINECNSFTLPAITGTNLNGTEAYYSEALGGGDDIPVGTLFTSDTTIYIFMRSGNCTGTKEIRITIDEFVVVGNDYSVCNNGGFVNLYDGLTPTISTGATFSGSTALDFTNAPSISILGVPEGAYNIDFIVSLPGCTPSSGSFVMNVIDIPDLGIVDTTTVCIGTTSFDLSELHPTTSASVTYLFGALGGIQSSNMVDLSSLMPGVYPITVSATNQPTFTTDFCVTNSEKFLEVVARPNAGMDVNISSCFGENIDLNTLLQGNDDIGQFFLQGNTIPLANNTVQINGTGMQTVVYYHILPATATCSADTARLTINLSDMPFAGLDASGGVCDFTPVNLFDYVTSADKSGQFILLSGSNFSILDSTLISNRVGRATVAYIVGNMTCGFDTALIDINLSVPITNRIEDSTCNPSYTLGGITLTPQNNDTTLMLSTVANCDSMVEIIINFLPASMSFYEQTLCEGDSILLNGKWYTQQRPSGVDTIRFGGSNNCDSIVNVEISFINQATGSFNTATCDENYSITIGGITFNSTNPTGYALLPNASSEGCDSLVNVQLDINPFTVDYSIVNPECDGDVPLLIINGYTGTDTLQYNINNVPGFLTTSTSTIDLNVGELDIVFSSSDDQCNISTTELIAAPQVVEVIITAQQLSDSTWQLGTDSDVDITTFFWSNTGGSLSCWDCPDPILTGESTVVLIYDYGITCVGDTSITLNSVRDNTYLLPNAIGGNGANKEFILVPKSASNDISINSFRVYDRWGSQIYAINNLIPTGPTLLWNGTFNGVEAMPGVYVYVLELTIDGSRVVRSGDITVLR